MLRGHTLFPREYAKAEEKLQTFHLQHHLFSRSIENKKSRSCSGSHFTYRLSGAPRSFSCPNAKPTASADLRTELSGRGRGAAGEGVTPGTQGRPAGCHRKALLLALPRSTSTYRGRRFAAPRRCQRAGSDGFLRQLGAGFRLGLHAALRGAVVDFILFHGDFFTVAETPQRTQVFMFYPSRYSYNWAHRASKNTPAKSPV